MKNLKNKRGMSTGETVVLFMGIIVILAFITAIASSASVSTQTQPVTNKSISVVNAWVNSSYVNSSINFTLYTQTSVNVQNCPLTSVVIRNGTGSTLTVTTDYTLDSANGRFSLVGTDSTKNMQGNVTYADFSYCGVGYNFNQSDRNIAGLWVLFCALILLAFILEKSGITNWTNEFR